MQTLTKLSGMTIASAAATLVLAGCSNHDDKHAMKMQKSQTAEVKCSGINACKGTSACATAKSACSGQNACKGQGWVKASAADCKAKGGKVVSG